MLTLQSIQSLINNNIEVCLLAAILYLLCIVRFKNTKKKLKKTNYKKVEKGFFNTGFKTSTSFYDVIKWKIRLNDYDDKIGVNYIYLISAKVFNWEFCKMKYKNQKGLVIKRNTKYTDL